MPLLNSRQIIDSKTATGIEPVDPDAINAELAARLRGCSLICELDIDETMHARLVAAMSALARRGTADDAWALRHHRALVATYLVADGLFLSVSGTFWPNLSVDGFTRASLGPVFEEALEVYRLERFTTLVEQGAHRYVARIFAHGGIPQHSLGDFFDVVFSAQRRGASDAREMVAYWREHSSRFDYVDSAVQRFLLHGGDVSLDFLDRCLDLARARPATLDEARPERFGLPAYVCEAFVQLDPNLKQVRESASVIASPTPSVVLDPWDATGPMLVLPSTTEELRGGGWSVVGQGEGARYPTGRTDRVVPLPPALHWQVELRRDDGRTARTFTFAGLSRTNALLFDYEDGTLVADPTRLRQPLVWILSPRGDDGDVLRGGDTPLHPLEVAPEPTGEWDGYRLAAYDLSGTDRLSIGRPRAGQPTLGRSFWVRIRGERIALDGEALLAVRTDGGLPVYAAAPGLRLPGFNGGNSLGSWHVRVAVDGEEYGFDATGLAEHGERVLETLIPDDRIVTAQVTARGPLGMDLRTTFCVIPGLQVQRPTAVLLPGRKPDEILAQVTVQGPDGRAERVDVRGEQDHVSATVHDRTGGAACLRITVPSLQWALLTEGDERGNFGQERLRLASGSVIDASLALLVVRTRQPGVGITLCLRHDERVLQEISATTAGDEGRWAFDLRRLGDTIRMSGEPVLALTLLVRGMDVPVAHLRADLNITNLRTRQRVVPGYVALTMLWEEGRPLKHRVARLWSLAAPWRAPIQAPIPDDIRGEATLSGSEDDIPPGCYMAEVAVDDGWSVIRRPSPASPFVRLIRLGIEADERHWLARQAQEDPYTVLTIAAGYGSISRSLDASEVERLTPAALDAMMLLREIHSGLVANGQIEAIARLLAAEPNALAEGAVAAALEWSAGHDVPFLTTAVELLPRLARSPAAHPAEDTATLWGLCPPLAALLDLPHHSQVEVRARIEDGLGIALSALASCQVVPPTAGRPPELQRLAVLPLPILLELQRACSLVPQRPLDLDTQAAAHFEWLIADKQQWFSAARWCAEHQGLLERSDDLRSDLALAAKAIRTPSHLTLAFPVMAFPELVHVAALHVVTGSHAAARSVAALRALIPVCPGIVTRSLVLAVALAHLSS